MNLKKNTISDHVTVKDHVPTHADAVNFSVKTRSKLYKLKYLYSMTVDAMFVLESLT